MKPDDLINQFLHQLNTVVTPGAEILNSELQQKIRSAAQIAFEKLDLVTRDEFDAQRAVLGRTREKLEAVEKQVAELEVRLTEK